MSVKKLMKKITDLSTMIIELPKRLIMKGFHLLTHGSKSTLHFGSVCPKSILVRFPHLPTHVEHPETLMAAIDRVYPLDETGILIFGWQFSPEREPLSIKIYNTDGDAVDIGGQMVPLLRLDVVEAYQGKFSSPVNAWCGFACLAPMPTQPGDKRALCYDFGERGVVWLKLRADKPTEDAVGLAKEILGMIPAPDKTRHNLAVLFDKGLGRAVEAVNLSRPTAGPVEERQFGRVVDAAISVIVPLYGRFDFLRHQLAQFADDPDFRSVDLVYVVDDPGILAGALELAAKYHPLFDIPFRMVWCGENRGFAGANNLGASVARGKYLLLMNSDVLPQQPGWLTCLRDALETLPDAGAVGPLLQFGDGSTQHAGMHPHREEILPGFLLNNHPGMGMAWGGPDEPSEHPMLTAACLLLRKRDYLALGGLDEGYIVGDFEDADLCMALRKRGNRMWLEPRAKLWHLERQSQNVGHLGQRQMLTLFNAWRYNDKIRCGIIADPEREN